KMEWIAKWMVLMAMFIVLLCAGLTSEVQGNLVLTSPSESLEMSSGGGVAETVTPEASVEDTSLTSDDGYFAEESEPVEKGSLGPGAITAIVIAAVLGVSVLFSLIIITVRKLSAS
uniref:Uncharacterized protein n=1 Tax=Callorhinchus milii TaxID=7868 RepID=A0A4W3JKN5_CALMI